MDNAFRHSSEVLAYMCGMLFCIGMGILMVGQISLSTLGLIGIVSLALLLLADGLLMWVSFRGLLLVLADREEH